MAYTYILYSEKLDKFYVGACINLERRIAEHNRGKSKFTRTGMPWNLVYEKEFPNLKNAKAYERKIKKRKSRKFILQLIDST